MTTVPMTDGSSLQVSNATDSIVFTTVAADGTVTPIGSVLIANAGALRDFLVANVPQRRTPPPSPV